MDEEYYYDDSDDIDRFLDEEAFYALTGGMYGDYDEWKEKGGDFDSLRDSLGY